MEAHLLATASQSARKLSVCLRRRPEARFFRADEPVEALDTREIGIERTLPAFLRVRLEQLHLLTQDRIDDVGELVEAAGHIAPGGIGHRQA